MHFTCMKCKFQFCIGCYLQMVDSKKGETMQVGYFGLLFTWREANFAFQTILTYQIQKIISEVPEIEHQSFSKFTKKHKERRKQ